MKRILFLLIGILAAAPAAAATLKVSSFPSGAQVSIDGVGTGKTTPMNVSLVEGDHVVRVEIPGSGWSADTRTVTIVAGNNDLSVTLLPLPTPGPQGPAGPAGPAGAPGAQGPPGPGVSSLADLSGVACQRGTDAGQLQVTVGATGAVSLTCVVATDNTGLTPDASTAAAALQFMLRAQNLSTSTVCSGSFGLFGTGWCIQGSATGFSVTPTTVNVTSTAAPFSFTAALNVPSSLFRVTYQISGISSSCNIAISGPVSVSGTVGFVASTPGGPLTRATLTGAQINVGGLLSSGCGSAGSLTPDMFENLQNTLVNRLLNSLIAPVCWQSSTNTFTGCS
jgi:hypothetical protein